MKSSLLLALTLMVMNVGPASTNPTGVTGRPLPSLAEARLAGTLPDVQGKVVLLDFWASWCAPCQASFPAMEELQKRFASRGLVILAVSVDENNRDYERFLERHKPAFSTVRDASHSLVSTMQAPTMPTSYLVDRQGVVRFQHVGFHGPATISSYVEQIEQLLGEPAP